MGLVQAAAAATTAIAQSADQGIHAVDIGSIDKPSKTYKEVQSIHKLLTKPLDAKIDVDIQISALKGKLHKKTRDALEFVVCDIRRTDLQSVGDEDNMQCTSKADLSELLCTWVSSLSHQHFQLSNRTNSAKQSLFILTHSHLLTLSTRPANLELMQSKKL